MNERLVDGRDLGAFIPASLDDYGLTPYEFRIYARIVRRAGKDGAWESVPSMSKACQIGEQKTKEVIRFLIKAGMIDRQSRPGKTTIYRLTPQHAWAHPENLEAIREESSYHPGVEDTQVLRTPGCCIHPGVEDTYHPGVEDTYKGNTSKVNQEGKYEFCAGAPSVDIFPLQEQEQRLVTNEGVAEEKKQKSKKASKKPKTAQEVYSAMTDEEIEEHDRFWDWYKEKVCEEYGARPGTKHKSAWAWKKAREKHPIEKIRKGCSAYVRQLEKTKNKNQKVCGIPNADNFLEGSERTMDVPYWLSALEEESPTTKANEFISDFEKNQIGANQIDQDLWQEFVAEGKKRGVLIAFTDPQNPKIYTERPPNALPMEVTRHRYSEPEIRQKLHQWKTEKQAS